MYSVLHSQHAYRVNRRSEIHPLLWAENKFLSLLSKFIVRFEYNSDKSDVHRAVHHNIFL